MTRSHLHGHAVTVWRPGRALTRLCSAALRRAQRLGLGSGVTAVAWGRAIGPGDGDGDRRYAVTSRRRSHGGHGATLRAGDRDRRRCQ